VILWAAPPVSAQRQSDVQPAPIVPLPLNPQTSSSVNVGYTQPLLREPGYAPTSRRSSIARLNAERSFFQFKDSMEQSVRGVIQGLLEPGLRSHRRLGPRQQVEQGEFTLSRAEADFSSPEGYCRCGRRRARPWQFQGHADRLEANLLNQEAALASIMALPPELHFLPMSPPTAVR